MRNFLNLSYLYYSLKYYIYYYNLRNDINS